MANKNGPPVGNQGYYDPSAPVMNGPPPNYQYNPNAYPPAQNGQVNPYDSYGQPQQPYGQPQQPYGQPQQPYGQPQQGYQGGGGPSYGPGYANPYGGATTGAPPPAPPAPPQTSQQDKIVPSSACRDVWAIFLWIASMGLFIALAVIGIPAIRTLQDPSGDKDLGGRDGTLAINAKAVGYVILLSVVGGAVVTMTWFGLMCRFARPMIVITFWLNLLITLGLAVFFFVVGSFIAGIVWAVVAVLQLLFYRSFKARMPLAALILTTVTAVIRQHPATIAVGTLGMVLQSGWACLFIATVAGMGQYFNNRDDSPALTYLAFVYLVLVFYWTTQVIRNTVHVTNAGLFATWYFAAREATLGAAQRVGTLAARWPVASAAKRALTTSFGSICFGSLLIALVQTLRTMLNLARQQAQQDGNAGLAILACFCECFVGCVGDMLEYFNTYAFVQVAMYGHAYVPAAKATWNLIKQRGFDIIINDSLVDNVLSCGMVLTGMLTGGVAYIFVRFANNSLIPDDPAYYVILVIVAFIVGISEFTLMSSVIESGVNTLFVGICEDPEVLRMAQPTLYSALQQAYPTVSFGPIAHHNNNNNGAY